MAHGSGKIKEHVPVDLKVDISHLDEIDKKIISLLRGAVEIANSVFLIQTNQDLEAQNEIYNSKAKINFYPPDITKGEIESYLQTYPEERKKILSPFTTVIKEGERLQASPYSQIYKEHFEKISSLLKQASEISPYPKFKNFLKLRAEAFLTNKFEESDKAWVTVDDSPFEFVIGPYESYLDTLFGIKRDIEGILNIVLSKETFEAKKFEKEIINFDHDLGQKYGYNSSPGKAPMVVVDQIAAGGFPLWGYVMMAYNLPNDPEIQRSVGTKKTFLRNIMQAKLSLITMPIAKKVLDEKIFKRISFEVFLKFVMGHEASHGLSFGFEGESFGSIYGPLEECKADVFGMIFLYYLAKKKLLEEKEPESGVIANITDGLRQIRFGLEEAHAIGTLIQYNYFLKSGALRIKGNTLVYNVELFEKTLDGLGGALYDLSKTKSPEAAEKFVQAWGKPPSQIQDLINKFRDVPVDIDPVFKF